MKKCLFFNHVSLEESECGIDWVTGCRRRWPGGHGSNSSDLSYALHALSIPRFKRISGLSRTEARVEDCRRDSFALTNLRPDPTLVNEF